MDGGVADGDTCSDFGEDDAGRVGGSCESDGRISCAKCHGIGSECAEKILRPLRQESEGRP